MKKTIRGFTLFELLVSISIIGILIAMVSVSFSTAQRKARDSKRTQDLDAIQKAAEQYYSLNNYTYPGSSGTWTVNGQTVLEVWPKDPKTSSDYSYTYNVGTNVYCVCVLLEETGKGNATNASCTFGNGGNYYCVKSQQ